MAETSPTKKRSASLLQAWLGKSLRTPLGEKLANTAPISWLLSSATQAATKQSLNTPQIPRPSQFDPVSHDDLHATLQSIVTDVVETLGYVCAMVSTYEPDDSLLQRAMYADPVMISMEQINKWEHEIAELIGQQNISLLNPNVARVFVSDPSYRDNLSVRAYTMGKPVRSSQLFNLFTPILPKHVQPIVYGFQQAMQVQEVIAVPFFLEHKTEAGITQELVGSLFALSKIPISANDERILSAFGRQAAAAILSERRRLQIQITQTLTFNIQNSLQDEQTILQHVVNGVVSELHYAAALLSTVESSGVEPIQAIRVDSGLADSQQVQQWVEELIRINDNKSLFLREASRPEQDTEANEGIPENSKPVLLNDQPSRFRDLFSLFSLMLPAEAQPVIARIQATLLVNEIIVLPLYTEQTHDGETIREMIGHLFVGTHAERFSVSDVELLQAFAQQASAGIRNARLYRRSENRRRASEIFGKMAFSASASVHTLKNQVGAIRGNLQVLSLLDSFGEEQRKAMLNQLPQMAQPILNNLDGMADILDSLHEPWRLVSDQTTNVNECVDFALRKAIPKADQWVYTDYDFRLLSIRTSPDMLREVFRVMIKNAHEAISAKRDHGQIWVSTQRQGDQIAVLIRDNGIGIKPEDLQHIFEMRWTTKTSGLGFGLFWALDYIEGLGGTIQVDSVVNEGSTFTVLLPMKAALQKAKSIEKAREVSA
jgi:signal transduction histidine kinase